MSLEQSRRELPTEAAKLDRTKLLAELEHIWAMTPRRKLGIDYPTAEQLVREDRDAR
jgi:hypothetical protein